MYGILCPIGVVMQRLGLSHHHFAKQPQYKQIGSVGGGGGGSGVT